MLLDTAIVKRTSHLQLPQDMVSQDRAGNLQKPRLQMPLVVDRVISRFLKKMHKLLQTLVAKAFSAAILPKVHPPDLE